MNLGTSETRANLTAHATSLGEFVMDVINTNADLSSLLLSTRRHLSSLDFTPDRLLDEMLHLAEHVQHLQCEISDASYFEKNKKQERTPDPLPCVYDKMYALCRLVRTSSAAASHYIDSVGSIAYDLELCFDSLMNMIGVYENMLGELDDLVDIVENTIPQETLPF